MIRVWDLQTKVAVILSFKQWTANYRIDNSELGPFITLYPKHVEYVFRRDHFGGLHFFNPVAVMKLLEVVRIPETSDDTFDAMMEWGKAMGKTCVSCQVRLPLSDVYNECLNESFRVCRSKGHPWHHREPPACAYHDGDHRLVERDATSRYEKN